SHSFSRALPTRRSSDLTFHDRYILTLTGRVDGKNVFAPGNRWGFFPGGAFAWRFSDEAFMEHTRSWLSDGKLRLSRGSVGNARRSEEHTSELQSRENLV